MTNLQLAQRADRPLPATHQRKPADLTECGHLHGGKSAGSCPAEHHVEYLRPCIWQYKKGSTEKAGEITGATTIETEKC